MPRTAELCFMEMGSCGLTTVMVIWLQGNDLAYVFVFVHTSDHMNAGPRPR